MKTIILLTTAILFSTTSFSQVTLDSTFGINGVVRTPIFPDHLVINSLAFQSDSNIVAAGYTFNYQFKIIRYLPNGLLDTSFGTNGITTISTQKTINVSDCNFGSYIMILVCDGVNEDSKIVIIQ